MASIEVKTFDKADEVVDKFNNAKIEAVKVGGQRVVRLHLKPGWKWSTDVKPHIGLTVVRQTILELSQKVLFARNTMMEQRLHIKQETLTLYHLDMTLG